MPEQPHYDDFDAPFGTYFDEKIKTLESLTDPAFLQENVTKNYVVVGTQNRRVRDNQLVWAINNMSEIFTAEPVIVTAYNAARRTNEWPTDLGPPFMDIPEVPPTTWDYTNMTKNLTPGPGPYTEKSGVPIIRLKMGDVVQIVMQNSYNLGAHSEAHPWHLHGHSFWQVGQGVGIYDPKVDDANFNLVNPAKRDTYAIYPDAWVAIRFKADNPGVWGFHCHVSPHLVMGMGLLVITSPDLLDEPPPASTSCLETSFSKSSASTLHSNMVLITKGLIALTAAFMLV